MTGCEDDVNFKKRQSKSKHTYIYGDLILEKENSEDEYSHFKIKDVRNCSKEENMTADQRKHKFIDENYDTHPFYSIKFQRNLSNSSISSTNSPDNIRSEQKKPKNSARRIKYIDSIYRRRAIFKRRKDSLLLLADEINQRDDCEVFLMLMLETKQIYWYSSPLFKDHVQEIGREFYNIMPGKNTKESHILKEINDLDCTKESFFSLCNSRTNPEQQPDKTDNKMELN